ncbi:GNAT family N-acetyltransferase [Nocardia ignorata]|uniref:Acetyltransferase (GNAT) family protein n=1 Tax=Nocardia ignorata TaxID=145285 RepID=A0A4R6P3K6_NOCIG|nr:GNAT family N-acetyltransferase [Nocardia ignorata]TDP31806.1 acetyltransferase (GNAT) family protein [Nocardia ignorata]
MTTTISGISYRELGPADRDSVCALHAGLVGNDGYFRFFAPPPKDLDRVIGPIASSDRAHCAVGAFTGDRLVGVANFVVLEDGATAEIAMVVAADEQHHGIGTDLLGRLAECGRARGIDRFIAEVMPTNSKAMRLIIDSDLPISAHRTEGVIQIAFHL